MAELPAFSLNPDAPARLDELIRSARFEVDANGCWLWKGPPERPRFSANGEELPAAKVLWWLFVGPLRDDIPLRPYCVGGQRCINPTHRRPLLNTCKRGHPRIPSNLNSGGRCKRCKSWTDLRRRHG